MKSLAKLFETKQNKTKMDGRHRCQKQAIFFTLEGEINAEGNL